MSGRKSPRPIYVEIEIRAPMEELWRRTQVPDLHELWDLRFTSIEYLPRPDPSAPQRFLYATRVGFGLAVRGEGESMGERDGEGGARSSALRFWSADRKSLITEGSGYWKYAPQGDGGIRFLTQYDYRTRFGLAGRLVDALFFRPLLGWATAWSFDRLRLWLEEGIDPSISGERALVHTVVRVTLGLIWIHQGLVPKLLFPNSGELEILRGSGILAGGEGVVLAAMGVLELMFGLVILAFPGSRWPFVVNVLVLPALALAAVFSSPAVFAAPFNPTSLTLAMLALAVIALVSAHGLASARRCRRRPPPEHAETRR